MKSMRRTAAAATAAATLTALFICFVVGPWLIRRLSALRVGQRGGILTTRFEGASWWLSGPTAVEALGDGELSKKLTVMVDAVSASAKEKIEKAGGTLGDKPVAAAKNEVEEKGSVDGE